MSINKLKTDITKLLYKKASYDTAAKAVGGAYIHFLDINVKNMAWLSRNATEKAIKHITTSSGKHTTGAQVLIGLKKGTPRAFSDATWEKIVRDVMNRFSWPGAHVLKKGSDYKIMIGPGSTKKGPNYKLMTEKIRREIFKEWQGKYSKLAENVKTLGTGYPDQRKGKGSRITHTDQSVYEAYLKLKAENVLGKFIEESTQFDVVEILRDNLQIELDEDTRTSGLQLSQKRSVELSLQQHDIPLPLDKQTKSMRGKFLRAIRKTLSDAEYLEGTGKISPKYVASTPFKKQVAQAAAHRLTKAALKKRKGLKIVGKNIPKKPKNTRRKAVLKKATKTRKPTKKKVSLPGRIAAARIAVTKEKGKGEKSTDRGSSLKKLRNYIQSRLGAEVRRNMGRPALRNRTGRFSNSVYLMSLTEGNSTIVAKYTYLLNPYATFENMGQRRWPLAYNPKPLIAKSI